MNSTYFVILAVVVFSASRYEANGVYSSHDTTGDKNNHDKGPSESPLPSIKAPQKRKRESKRQLRYNDKQEKEQLTEPSLNMDYSDPLGASLDNALGDDAGERIQLENMSYNSDSFQDPLGASMENVLHEEDQMRDDLEMDDALGTSLQNVFAAEELERHQSPISNSVFDETPLQRPGATSTPKKVKSKNKGKQQFTLDTYDEFNFYTSDDDDEDDDQLYSLAEVTPRHSKAAVPKKKNRLLARALASSGKCLKVYCKNKCLGKHSLLQVQDCRKIYWNKNSEGRQEWLLDKFRESTMNTKFGRIFTESFGFSVCPKCFQNVYLINKNLYSKTMKEYKNGFIAGGSRRINKISIEKEEVIYWLKDYFSSVGDRMPHKDLILLPYGTIRQVLYQNYKTEQARINNKAVSRTMFLNLWRTEFSHVKIKKTNSFSKCDKCSSLERCLKETRNEGTRANIKAKLKAHHQRQQDERSYYYSKRKKAEDNPKKYLSLITDGMDQSKTDVPHMLGRKAKCLDSSCILQTHVQGIINHGLRRFDKYIDIKQYPHDSNLVLHVLLNTIYETSILMDNRLPPILYVQADNCWRENKNIYILGFCELLVRRNIFKEVHLSFLFVGHTHEDIDAGFSKLAEKLRKTDAETPETLKYALGDKTKFTRGVFDIKKWLLPHLSKLAKHSTQHHYKFSKDYKTNIKVEYRKSIANQWLNFAHPVLETLPTGTPDVVEPNLSKIDTKSLRKTIQNCKHMFSEFYTTREEKIKEWNQLIPYIEQVKDSPELRKRYGSKYARWTLPLLPRQDDEPENEMPVTLDPNLQRQLDEEITTTQVIQTLRKTGKRTSATESRRNSTGKKSQGNNKKKRTEERTKKKTNNYNTQSILYFTMKVTEVSLEVNPKEIIMHMIIELIENLILFYGTLYLLMIFIFGLIVIFLVQYLFLYLHVIAGHCQMTAVCNVTDLVKMYINSNCLSTTSQSLLHC